MNNNNNNNYINTLNNLTSLIATDIHVSEGLHKHLAVYVHGARAHGSEETSLVEIADNGVRVHELRGTSQVIAVAFFAPAIHWTPSGALKLKGASLIWQVDHTIGNVVDLSVLIKTPHFQVELGPKRFKTCLRLFTIPGRFRR